MNLVGNTLFSIASYYISSKVPADIEMSCKDYARAQKELQIITNLDNIGSRTYNPITKKECQETVDRAYFWVKNPSLSSTIARVTGLVFQAASIYLWCTPPVAIGLTLLKAAEIVLFQINDYQNELGKEEHSNSSFFTAAKALRLANRIINLTAFSIPAIEAIDLPFVFAPIVFFSAELSIAATYALAVATIGSDKRGSLLKSEIYIPEFVRLK